MRAISIGYHDVLSAGSVERLGPLPQPGRYAVSRNDLRRHLETMSEKYKLQPSIIGQAGQWGEEVPLFITFDDGTMGAYRDGADELERLGWRGHFFITTDWIGKPGFMDKSRLRDLHDRGHIIGSHTCSHPSRMSRLSWNELLHEWRDSCAVLSDILGRRIKTGSVADGYYSSLVGRSASVAGIEALFNSDPVTTVLKAESCLVLGRYAVFNGASAERVASIAAGARFPRFSQFVQWRAKDMAKSVLGESYLRARNVLLSRGFKHAPFQSR